jgi:DNA-binding FadR family transcriptional regulator
MLAPLWRALAAVRRPQPPMERSVAAHRDILEAVSGREAGRARAAMSEHLVAVERELHARAGGRGTGAGGPTPSTGAGRADPSTREGRAA